MVGALKLSQADFQQYVKSKLDQLLRVSDLEEFQKRFAEVIAYLEVEHQNAMALYLKNNYLGKVKSLASFNTQGAVMDTTMLSERWHLRLKSEVLHRNANSRADCLVELLIRPVEDLADSNEIKDRRQLASVSFKSQQTTIRHRDALVSYNGRPEKIRIRSSRTWDVHVKGEEWVVVKDKGY